MAAAFHAAAGVREFRYRAVHGRERHAASQGARRHSRSEKCKWCSTPTGLILDNPPGHRSGGQAAGVLNYSGPVQGFGGDDLRHSGMPIVKKFCETVEIGKRCCRPLQDHRSCHGLKAGVPQVCSHRATSSCGTVPSPPLIEAHWRSSSANSAKGKATGVSASAVMSATNSETVIPCAAALPRRAAAVAASTSIA